MLKREDKAKYAILYYYNEYAGGWCNAAQDGCPAEAIAAMKDREVVKDYIYKNVIGKGVIEYEDKNHTFHLEMLNGDLKFLGKIKIMNLIDECLAKYYEEDIRYIKSYMEEENEA